MDPGNLDKGMGDFRLWSQLPEIFEGRYEGDL